jgi:hypothetical protein
MKREPDEITPDMTPDQIRELFGIPRPYDGPPREGVMFKSLFLRSKHGVTNDEWKIIKKGRWQWFLRLFTI